MQSTGPEQLSLCFEANLPLLSADEIYEDCSQTLLSRLKEDRRIEKKGAKCAPRELGVYFSMWANTNPDGGIIVVGISNDEKFEGCSHLSQNELNDLEKTAIQHCPDARFDSKRISIIRDDGQQCFLLVFRVYYRQDKVVETHTGEAWTRLGDSKKKLTAEEVRELQIDKGQIRFENEPCGLSYPDDFDESLIQNFVSSVKERLELKFQKSDTEILINNCLGQKTDRHFVPNNACALLFAKNPKSIFPGCRIRFLRFEGELEGTGEKFNPVKDKWIDGNVPTLIKEAETVVESQLREFTRLGKDGKFYTAPEYPKDAWYEAIVNACCHRSYGLRNMCTFIKMFDDRLVVESAGPFPPMVTPKNIYESHHPRNPHLMHSMMYLDFVKCANEGTRRMRDVMKVQGLPEPEFEQKEFNAPSVRVTLRNDIKQRKVWVDSDASRLVGEAVYKTLNQEDIRTINFAAEHESINVSEVQRLLQKSWPAARKLLDRLVKRGILKHHHRPTLERDPQAFYTLEK